MKTCTVCNVEKDTSEFNPYYGESRKVGLTRNVCKKCKNKKQIASIKNNPERLKKYKEYHKKYHKENNHIGKVKSYRTSDRKNKRESITLEEFKEMLAKTPKCFYCGHSDPPDLGLDRLDNTLGHLKENVVICCEKCNHILTDLPLPAKLCLKEGLRKIEKDNLLLNWTIKTKRKKYA